MSIPKDKLERLAPVAEEYFDAMVGRHQTIRGVAYNPRPDFEAYIYKGSEKTPHSLRRGYGIPLAKRGQLIDRHLSSPEMFTRLQGVGSAWLPWAGRDAETYTVIAALRVSDSEGYKELCNPLLEAASDAEISINMDAHHRQRQVTRQRVYLAFKEWLTATLIGLNTGKNANEAMVRSYWPGVEDLMLSDSDIGIDDDTVYTPVFESKDNPVPLYAGFPFFGADAGGLFDSMYIGRPNPADHLAHVGTMSTLLSYCQHARQRAHHMDWLPDGITIDMVTPVEKQNLLFKHRQRRFQRLAQSSDLTELIAESALEIANLQMVQTAEDRNVDFVRRSREGLVVLNEDVTLFVATFTRVLPPLDRQQPAASANKEDFLYNYPLDPTYNQPITHQSLRDKAIGMNVLDDLNYRLRYFMNGLGIDASVEAVSLHGGAYKLPSGPSLIATPPEDDAITIYDVRDKVEVAVTSGYNIHLDFGWEGPRPGYSDPLEDGETEATTLETIAVNLPADIGEMIKNRETLMQAYVLQQFATNPDAIQSVATPDSSSILAVGYTEADGGLLVIQFKGNPDNLYIYQGVKRRLYQELIGAESVGSYYAREIKPYIAATVKVAVEDFADIHQLHIRR